jgi:hypothetical protein
MFSAGEQTSALEVYTEADLIALDQTDLLDQAEALMSTIPFFDETGDVAGAASACDCSDYSRRERVTE